MKTTGRSLSSPFRVVIIGADMKPRKIYVVLGKVSSAISNAVQRYKIMTRDARKSADKILSEAYGDNYRSLLALDTAESSSLAKYALPALNPDEIIGGHEPRGFTRSEPHDVSAWYDPDDYEGMSTVFGGNDQPTANTTVTVNISDISNSLAQYSAEWFAEHRDCIAGADLTAPIVVTQVGPDLVPRGPESICAVRRAMEIGIKTLPAVIRTTTPVMTSRSIRYNDESARNTAPLYSGSTRISRTTVTHPRGSSSQFTGGLLEDEEIEALLNEDLPNEDVVNIAYSTGLLPPKNYAGTPVAEYVTTVGMLSLDKFTELSEKIQLITDIPLYRQHLCWIESGQLKTAYAISANGIIDADIRMINRKNQNLQKQSVIGVPVNRTLYNRRDIVRVETHDAFKLVGGINTVYIADLAEWLSPVRSQLQDIMQDSYQMDLLYWGFIVLYWPRLTRECFYVYTSAESSLAQLYPDLLPAKTTLKLRASEEQMWFDHVHAMSNRVEAFLHNNITTAVTTAVATIKNAKVILNLRNIIEFMPSSPEIPEIRAHIPDHPRKYIIRRIHASAVDVLWPTGAIYRSGVTIMIKPSDHNIIFMNIGADGTVNIKISAPEEDAIGFHDIYKIVSLYANPVIEQINKMGRYVFISGSMLSLGIKTNMIFGSLNMCLYWKRAISTSAFNVLKSSFDRLMRAGITQPRTIQQADKYELLFCKAMHWFDSSTIDRIMLAVGGQPLMNQYAYMSVANVKQKWDNAYSGRIVRIGHRTTDIRFEIIDIREDEFRILSEHITTLLYDVANELRTNPVAPPRSQKRLRKLREEDPDLFNLKKYGSKKVYSILCQNMRQPVIYTPDEVDAMDANARKRLVKYINFTKNTPAYYACPTSLFPNLGYLVGDHPKGYCLPCCNKRIQSGKKTDIYETCSTCGKWTGDSPGVSSRHIMSYVKNTEIGRLSRLPTSIHNVLNPLGTRVQRGRKRADNIIDTSTSDMRGYYILGVEQTMPGVPDAGFIHACARALGYTPADMIQKVITAITSSDLYMTAQAGQLTAIWRSSADLIITLQDLFIFGKTWSTYSPPQWDSVIFSLVTNVFNVGILYWRDSVTKTSFEYILPTGTLAPNAYIMIVRRSDYYVPIVQITHSMYSRKGHVGEPHDDEKLPHSAGQYGGQTGGLFSADGPTGKIITSMINWTSVDHVHGLQWVTKKLGPPSAVYVDRNSVSSSAIWKGVYVTIRPSVPIESHANIIHKESYTGPLAAPENAIGVLKELVGDLTNLAVTAAVDCVHIHVGNVGVITEYAAIALISPISLDDGMKTAGISMLDVMRIMHDGTPGDDDPSITGLGRAFYETHQYTLFLLEFVNLLSEERNKVIRGKLAAEIDRIALPRGLGQLKRFIRNILHDWTDDFALIMSMISAASLTGTITRAVLHQIIDSEVYEFDNTTLTTLKSMKDDVLKNTLTDIAQKFVVEVDKLPEVIDFPNVFGSCTSLRPDGRMAGYCHKHKLMINVPLANMIDILAADLRNPIKSKYLLNGTWLETTLDWFDFQRKDDERVIVYRM